MRIVVDVLLLLPALLYQTTLAANLEVRGVGVDLIAWSGEPGADARGGSTARWAALRWG
mgnify:CR=1 FL=1